MDYGFAPESDLMQMSADPRNNSSDCKYMNMMNTQPQQLMFEHTFNMADVQNQQVMRSLSTPSSSTHSGDNAQQCGVSSVPCVPMGPYMLPQHLQTFPQMSPMDGMMKNPPGSDHPQYDHPQQFANPMQDPSQPQFYDANMRLAQGFMEQLPNGGCVVSSPSSRAGSRPPSRGDPTGSQEALQWTGPNDERSSPNLMRSVSSPVNVHNRLPARSRGNSFGSGPANTKSPLRAGFPAATQSPVPPGSSSPLPYEYDLARIRVGPEEEPTSSPGSPRHDGDDNHTIRRVRANSGVNRASSLPIMSKRPTGAMSPRAGSPRLSRRIVTGQRMEGSPSPADSLHGLEGVVMMEVEPAQFGRFRYEAEGRQNCLEGEKNSFPTVCISQEWASYVPDGTPINVSLVRRHDLKPHHHLLVSKDGGETRQYLRNGRAVFPNLVVKRQRSALRYPPEDQRAVRLLFSMTFIKDGTPTDAFCVSKPIFNSDLKICGCSHRCGPADQWTDAILLCSKVQKKSIAIRIAENTESDYVPPAGMEGWQQAPDGTWVCVLRAGFEVHHQYAIAFRFPPFYDQSLQVSREVVYQLIDLEDETSSNFETFTYIGSHYDTNV